MADPTLVRSVTNYKLGLTGDLYSDGSVRNTQAIAPGGPGSFVPPTVTQQAEKRVESLNSQADQATALHQQADYIANRAGTGRGKTSTGGVFGLPIVGGPLADISGTVDPPLKEMQAASLSMAKDLRAPGQRLTQMEWAKNLGAVPGAAMSVPAIRDQQNKYLGGAQMAAAHAAFVSNWVTHMKTDDGAEPAWQKWKAQNFDSDGNYHAGGVPAAQAPTSDGGWKYVGPVQ